MDVVVNNFYRNKAAVLAEWETARHVERAPRRKKATPEEPPKSPTPSAYDREGRRHHAESVKDNSQG
jgi:hypothetical protein